MTPEVLTSEQAAEYLQLGLSTVKRLARAGAIPAAKAGRQWRFRKADLDAWLTSGGAREGHSSGHRSVHADSGAAARGG